MPATTSSLFLDPSDDPVLVEQARDLARLGEVLFYKGAAAAAATLVPNPPMPIAEWAPRYAFIPASKTTRGGPAVLTPVQKGLARLLQRFGTEVLIFLKPPRIGSSTFAALVLLYYATWEQSDALLYERTDDKGQEFNKEKIMPILRASTALRDLLRPDGKTGEQDTWDNREYLNGASMKIRSISNTKHVKGVRGRIIVGEECGDIAWADGEEGSKTPLLIARGQEFGDGRVYLSGTPTVKGRCLVSGQHETSFRHVYRMDCPHCGHRQEFVPGTPRDPEVVRVRTSKDRLGRPGMRYVKDADGLIADVWYECANLDCPVSRIEDRHKSAMLEGGDFEPESPTQKGQRGRIGAFVWSAYSEDPKSSWFYLAESHDLLWVNGSEKERMSFVTMWMAMPYEEGPPPEADTSHMERNSVILPDGIDTPADSVFLVASIDNQENPERSELKVEATMKGGGSFVVHYEVLDSVEMTDGAGTTRRFPIRLFDEQYARRVWDILDRDWITADGEVLRIQNCFVDCGWPSEPAWKFCMLPESRNRGCIPVRGDGTERGNRRVPLLPPGRRLKRSKKSGRSYLYIGTREAKDEIARRQALHWPEPGSFGFSHRLPESYFRSRAAERLMPNERKVLRWTRIKESNTGEAWDNAIYCYAAREYVMEKNSRIRKAVGRLTEAEVKAAMEARAARIVAEEAKLAGAEEAPAATDPVKPESFPPSPSIGGDAELQPPAATEHVTPSGIRFRVVERPKPSRDPAAEAEEAAARADRRSRRRNRTTGIRW